MKSLVKSLFVALALVISVSAVSADGYKVGDKTSSFELKNVSGEMVSLTDFPDAKGFIVVFTCNTCPYANKYEQRIIELHQKYADQGYPVIAVNPNDPNKSPGDSFAKMKARASEKDYPFPYLVDENSELARKFGASYTPHVFVLDRKAADQFTVAYIGAIDDNSGDPSKVQKPYVEKVVEAMIDGQKPPYDKVKGIGCGIKWS